MTARSSSLALGALLIASSAVLATDDHFDVFLTVDAQTNTLTTGRVAFHLPGQPVEFPIRIFTEPMGKLGVPTFTDAPGFFAKVGDLPPSTLIGYDITDTLRIWSAADGHFDDPAPESLSITRFGTTIETPTFPATFAAGFWLGISSSSGSLHDHADFFLLPAPGNTDPQPGLYLLTLTLRTDSPAIAHAEPIYIVFDFETNGAQLQPAVAWLNDLITPPPACPGDINADGATNLDDFIILAANFGVTSGASRAQGDLNGDGAVNLDDFIILASDFGCTE
ncbi:MAG: hypothetical protein EA380_03465 [Phycisphaeraceae bacterium]|nr:MAG: hypothetical protein EA380_03465 [Phycisphaeraceae bacterium]